MGIKLGSISVEQMGWRKFLTTIVVSVVLFAGAFGVSYLFTNINQSPDPSYALASTGPDDPSNFTMDPATDITGCGGQSECFAFTIDTSLTPTGATDAGQSTDFSLPTLGPVGGEVVANPYDG